MAKTGNGAEFTAERGQVLWIESEGSYILNGERALGISEPTLKRAKKRLRVKSNKLPDEWYWELPIE